MKYDILHGLNTQEGKCQYCDDNAYVKLTINLEAVDHDHKCESRFCSIRNVTLETIKYLCATCLNEKLPHDFTHMGKINYSEQNELSK
jgi:hypothetical protein